MTPYLLYHHVFTVLYVCTHILSNWYTARQITKNTYYFVPSAVKLVYTGEIPLQCVVFFGLVVLIDEKLGGILRITKHS